MRNLELNKTLLWYVYPTGETEQVDDDGFLTGTYVKTWSVPESFGIVLSPVTSEAQYELFGKDNAIDMVGITCDVVLTDEYLIFESMPTGDYENTFDYNVTPVTPTINSRTYGFTRRL